MGLVAALGAWASPIPGLTPADLMILMLRLDR